MKFSELITKLHSASQPHMLMYIDIRSDCELADVNILASGQSDVQAGTLYFADAGQLTPDTVADQPAVLRHAAAGASGQTDEQRHDRSR